MREPGYDLGWDAIHTPEIWHWETNTNQGIAFSYNSGLLFTVEYGSCRGDITEDIRGNGVPKGW